MTAGGTQAAAGPRWYCVRTRAKAEHIALEHLRRLPGVEPYCPRIRYRKATRRGPVWFTEALFPGYLFARFDLATDRRAVAYTTAVTGLVQFGGRPAVLPGPLVDRLREQVADGEVKVLATPFEPGQSAEVLAGPFAGLEVVVRRVLPARDRVRILLTFLGRETEADVPADSLRGTRRHPLERKDGEAGHA